MYKAKKFELRPMEEILEDFDLARQAYSKVGRIFLADGDALIRPAADLERILEYIAHKFPECERVTCYASPSSIHKRTPEELKRLRERNLTMVYMGLESGCDEVLKRMRKGHTAADIVSAGQKINAAGIDLSVTAISGLGGVELWREHAMDTAAALSAMKPAYIGLLTLMVEPGTSLYDWARKGEFQLLDSRQVLEETALLVAQLDCEGAVFRMNHASNYLTLKGTLNQDKQAMLQRIHSAMTGRTDLRPEYFRAL
jgi:radical SAM superfamily enzyme YgiQ (UPF0313 family)